MVYCNFQITGGVIFVEGEKCVKISFLKYCHAAEMSWHIHHILQKENMFVTP